MIRNCIYMNKKFFLLVAETINFRIIIVYCNTILVANLFSKGCLPKVENYGNSRGWGGGGVGGGFYKYSLEWKFQKGGASKAKVFSVRGIDILGNYTI